MLILGILYLLIIRLRLIFSYSLNLEGAEFSAIHTVQLLLNGQSLYKNPASYPFDATIYLPLYHYLLFFICSLCGINPFADIHSIYAAGRAFSLVTLLINLFVLDRFICLFNKNLLVRVAGIFVFVILLPAHIYTARPDALELLFFTLFIYYIYKYIFVQPNIPWLVYALFSAQLSLFSKQDSLLLTFSFLGLFFLYERSRRSFIILAVFAVITAIALALAYWVWGPYFFTNIILWNIQTIKRVDPLPYVKLFILSIARLAPLIFAGAYVLYKEWKEKRRNGSAMFIAIAALFYLLVAHVMVLRAGSHINYINPVLLLLTICFGIFSSYDLPWLKRRLALTSAFITAYLLVVIFSNQIFHNYTYNTEDEDLNRQRYTSLMQLKPDLLNIANNDTVFFLNPKYCIFLTEKQLIYGYDMHIDRMIEVLTGFHIESRLAFVSTAPYDEQFNRGTVKYIIAEKDSLSQQQMKKNYAHFHEDKMLQGFTIYKYLP